MERKRHHSIPLFSTRATATVSVALVLLILGIAALTGIAMHNVAQNVRENMGYVVILNDDLTASQIEKIKKRIESAPSTKSVDYASPEVVLKRWQQMIGEDEDILQLANVNPFFPEMEVHVKAPYASPDSLDAIVAPVTLLPEVVEVKIHAEVIDTVNSTMANVTLTLLIVAAALLIISFVLIFNTIRLAVYSRRFTIYTMKLVGATDGFIRRPFLTSNIVSGIVAGIIASAITAALVYYTRSLSGGIGDVVTWETALPVFGGMIILGIIICLIAAFMATNRYLRRSYDDMFH